MIQIRNLSKHYTTKESSLTAVDRLNLDIEDGEIFGVIGYSGAGKSTFVRLINRLEQPSEGNVLIENQDITKLRESELRLARQGIGMIFQHFNLLWSRTVAENISFPLEIAGMKKADREKRVNELIELVGLKGREKAYPSQLSGGQKQRVGIARALANKPKLLLCDEATSALDPETTNSILDLLVDINEKMGLTIILITHEMQVIRKICHRVAVMEAGKVVEQGNVLDVFHHPKQEVTKKFVAQEMGSSEEDENFTGVIDETLGGKLLKFQFIGESANQALISELAKKFPVDLSILQGKITQTKAGSYGTMFVHVTGDDVDIQRMIDYVASETSVDVEVK